VNAPSPDPDLVRSIATAALEQAGGDRDGRILIYAEPDQVDPEQDVSERRPAVLQAHFGDARIDCSRPR